ncbi:MAG: NFACT family protein, partial [Clostridia bacterium]|nr:NFACT family protein [Clostridia bacterium]
DDAVFMLTVELMGRYANIIFTDENNKIIDCTRRVGADMSSVRQIAPGITYVMPPKQDKKDPREAIEADFANVLTGRKKINAALVEAFFGLSPDMAKRLVKNVTDKTECDELTDAEKDALTKYLVNFYSHLKSGEVTPHLLLDENESPIKIYPFCIEAENSKAADSMQAGLDELYASKDIRQQMYRMSASYRKVIKNNIERCERKLSMFSDTLNMGAEIEKMRLYGELITANLYALKQGMKSAVVMNYYDDPPKQTEIPLDPSISPTANAQRYYKQYRKSKAAFDMAQSRREETLYELNYLEGMLCDLENVTSTGEMLDIRDELLLGGYIKEQKNAKKARPRAATEPLKYISSQGIVIYVGKNNKQNDKLTFSIADSEDIWMHIKNAPGSHVIVKSDAPDKQTLYEAAMLAAYYSSQRGGVNVAIDYTKRKNVKKPSGSKPGMVIYLKNTTAFVTPSESFIKSLHKE